MTPSSDALYKALISRDSRFDGIFFVGVTSTGIYCRPICPVKPPRKTNCRFFNGAPEAEQAGFRPCLRCRPELAPGLAPVDDSQRIAHSIVQRIEEGSMDDNVGLEKIASQFELSSRQIRRIVQKELGVPPIQLLLTRRLLLAKQLLTETRCPVTEIAFASGFSSLRRFNDAFNRRYGMPPTRLRRRAVDGAGTVIDTGTSTLQLSYRPPYDWTEILSFLEARALKGTESVTANAYARTVQLGNFKGWIRITQAKNRHMLLMEFAQNLMPVLPALLNRIRSLFDLNARPDIIAGHLGKDRLLGPMVKTNPGMRVPGAFHGFELGMRAILGQQVSVKAATTIAGRIVEAFGEPIVTPLAELNRLSPTAATIAQTNVVDLAHHGIVGARCKSIVALAQAEVSGALSLETTAHSNADQTIHHLVELPGIGHWTAQYMAMRALRWPDAFPKEDIAIRKSLGGITAKQAEEVSQRWRPWRSYAVLYLWKYGTGMQSPKGENK